MRKNIIEEDLEDIFQRNIPWEKLKGTTVLITGAYGMLASYVVFMLLYLNERKMIPVKIIALVRSKEKFAWRKTMPRKWVVWRKRLSIFLGPLHNLPIQR